ncbi:MAG: hypothetical protein AAGG09_04350 [Pseudomonadota bacterium]
MARSYSSSDGLANPWLIGALAILAMATFFEVDGGLFSRDTLEDRLAEFSDLDAELTPRIPAQTDITAPDRPLLDPAYTATPLHFFTVEALVLSRKTYRHDTEAGISPVDLMLGWGPMSNPSVVSQIRMRQSRRFGYVSTRADADVDLDALSPFWTNAHLIPNSPEIAEALDGIAAGDVLRLEGALVDVHGPDGWRWETSTSRTDTGNGACEILLVTAVHVLR